MTWLSHCNSESNITSRAFQGCLYTQRQVKVNIHQTLLYSYMSSAYSGSGEVYCSNENDRKARTKLKKAYGLEFT